MDYQQAGVDVVAGRAFVQDIRGLVEQTRRPEVLGRFGAFSSLFQLPKGYREPVLVSGTDGVGTKLKIAQAMDCHTTVGIDLVAMCANDVLTAGAEPLFFLDYLATGALDRDRLTRVVAGIAEGCTLAGCALVGGETAEMPGFYAPGEYDLAGFCVGIVNKPQILDGQQVQIGDQLIGLASAGVHSNGFSLVRQIVADQGLSWSDRLPELGGSLGEVLLTPTRIYVKAVLAARSAGLEIRGMAHITGGGLPENLPRCLGPDQGLRLIPRAWPVPPVFTWLAKAGQVSARDMYHTFNMGIGFGLVVPPDQGEQALTWFTNHGHEAYVLGTVVEGAGELGGLP